MPKEKNKIGINFDLRYRKVIEYLKKKNEKLYLQNQIMKRRLAKHEGSRAMVNYYNKKESA